MEKKYVRIECDYNSDWSEYRQRGDKIYLYYTDTDEEEEMDFTCHSFKPLDGVGSQGYEGFVADYEFLTLDSLAIWLNSILRDGAVILRNIRFER